MNVYQLCLTGSDDVWPLTNDIGLSVTTVTGTRTTSALPVDKSFMVGKYGFELSDAEIMCFRYHVEAWHMFRKSMSQCCLIVEDHVISSASADELIGIVQALPYEWDVFFPFDEQSAVGTPGKSFQAYAMGFQWGSFAYFLSRSGVEKLLNIREIRQPVDDEIIMMAKQDQIQFLSASTSLFKASVWKQALKERDEKIRQAVLSLNVWSYHDKELVRNLLRDVVTLAADIPLILDSGTLLGHVRHGGIMQWDDDVDIAIDKSDLTRLVALLNNSTISFGKFTWSGNGCDYYKVWYDEGESVKGKEYKFPFIDIWVFTKDHDRVTFWHGSNFDRHEFLPLRSVEFEGVSIMEPNLPLKCLDRIYDNWRTHIHVYPWRHKLEKSLHTPLIIPITVSAEGKMVCI